MVSEWGCQFFSYEVVSAVCCENGSNLQFMNSHEDSTYPDQHTPLHMCSEFALVTFLLLLPSNTPLRGIVVLLSMQASAVLVVACFGTSVTPAVMRQASAGLQCSYADFEVVGRLSVDVSSIFCLWF